jgi:hypothetical protein
MRRHYIPSARYVAALYVWSGLNRLGFNKTAVWATVLCCVYGVHMIATDGRGCRSAPPREAVAVTAPAPAPVKLAKKTTKRRVAAAPVPTPTPWVPDVDENGVSRGPR